LDDIIAAALQAATDAGASYADVRIVDTSREDIAVATGVVEGVERSDSFGLGVRAIAEGAWGFASSANVTADSAARVAREAVAIARASALVAGEPLALAPVEAARGTWASTYEIDPFTVSLEDKLACSPRRMRPCASSPPSSSPRRTSAFAASTRWFGSTEGARTEQTALESGAGIVATP
jgi:TldD protein